MPSIIFYGAGRNAKENVERWIKEGLRPVAFADKDERKAGTYFETGSGRFEILPLEEVISRYHDYVLYVTLIYQNAGAAVKYLTGQGIPKERVKCLSRNELHSKMSLADIQQTVAKNGLYGKAVAEPILKKYSVLFDFAEQLKHNANFKTIEVTDGKVIAKMRQYPVKFCITPNNFNAVTAMCASRMQADLFTAKLYQMFLGKKCIIDIGANIGFYTCLAGKLNPLCQVHSFEPIPQTFEILNENIRLNGLTNVIANNLALSDKPKADAVMHYSEYDEGSQSLAYTRDDGNKRDVSVAIDSLDNYVDRYGIAPDFIKIDTEGHEMHVLKGSERTLRKHKPIIISETEPAWLGAFGNTGQEVFDFLFEIGYSAYRIDGTELSDAGRVFPANYESNYVFK